MAVSKPLPGTLLDYASPAVQTLLAAWVLNEGAGKRANDARANKFGTLTNFAYSSTSGWTGDGVIFDGVNDYIDLGLPVLVNGRSAYSIYLRVVPKSIGSVQLLYSEATSVGVVNGIYLNTTGSLNGYINNGTDNICASTTTAVAGRVYDVVLTVDQAAHTMKVYVNGRLETTLTSWSGTYSSGIATVSIGCAKSGTQHFNGIVSHCFVFGSALNAATVQALTTNPWQLWPDDQIVFAPASGINVTPDPATLTLTGYAPTVTAPAAVTPTPASLTLTGYAPTVTAPASITPTPATLTLTGYPPTVTTSAATNDSEWIITARRRGRR